MIPFSNRLPSSVDRNALTARLEQWRHDGVAIADLTESNPTVVGLAYPSDALAALGRPDALKYTAAPFGLVSARQAIAADCRRRDADIDPEHIVLTASTSEAYTWLFKLFCNPGDRVLVPRPSYPLFEHLARLEGIALDPYDLDYRGRWDVDLEAIGDAGDDVRAVIVVSPNNPTGSCISRQEFEQLSALCAARDWALIVDEVFADYLFETDESVTDLAADPASPCLTVTLGGLSKSVGLPQVKVGWMLVGGPAAERDRALAGLELIADSFLSVSTPAQLALPELLRQGVMTRKSIQGRLETNLSFLKNVATDFAQCDVPTVEGGWSAVIRVPAVRPEETLVLELLDREHILVYPGFFFDFQREAYLIVSLLVPPDVFREATPRLFRAATR